jgi:hypothetical protein
MKGLRWGTNKSPARTRCWRGGPCCRSCWPLLYMSAISCSSSRALCSSSRIIWRTLACTVTRWRLASRMSFCFWRLRFLMHRARSYSCSSAEMPMTSPSSAVSSPSGGAKPGGGACGSLPELQVCRVPSGVGCSWRCLLLRALSSEASWGVLFVRALPFFSASSAAFAASSMDGATFELARLGAITGDLFVARMVGAKCWYSLSRQVNPTGEWRECLQSSTGIDYSSVSQVSQGHYTRVFIGTRTSTIL